MNNVVQRNTSIDTSRLIAAFLVVCLHTHFPISYLGVFVSDLAKIAVPLFLIISGYYLFSDSEQVVLKRSTTAIFKITVVLLQAGVVYALLRIFKHYHLGIDISSQNFKLLPFLLFNDNNFTEHLWYVFAYLYDLIIIWILCKIKLFKYILYTLPFLILIYLLITLWSRYVSIGDNKFWIEYNWLEYNWLVIGLPFLVTGMFLKKHINWINQINHKYLPAIIIFLIFSIFGEHYAFKMFVGKGPGVIAIQFLAIAVFIYCILDLSPFNLKINLILSELGRKHALNIYLYHILIREIITINNGTYLLNNSIVIFAITLILSIIIENAKNSIITNKFN